IVDGKLHAGFMHFSPQTGTAHKKAQARILAEGAKAFDHFLIQYGGLGVAMPHDHPLAKRKSLSLADLANEHFVVVPRSSVSPSYGQLFSLCQKEGFEPHIVQEVATITTQLNLVSVGVGIGVTMIGKHFTYPEGLVVVKLKDVSYKTTF